MKEIALHILDIVQNSIVAQASLVTIRIEADSGQDRLSVFIEDNGSGMDERLLDNVTSPFTTTRTTRKVGLGVPLFKANAERAAGRFEIRSEIGRGTTVLAEFGLRNIDRLPMGDLVGTMVTLVLGAPEVDYHLLLRNGEREFDFATAEVREVLGPEIPLNTMDVLQWIQQSIQEGYENTFGGLDL